MNIRDQSIAKRLQRMTSLTICRASASGALSKYARNALTKLTALSLCASSGFQAQIWLRSSTIDASSSPTGSPLLGRSRRVGASRDITFQRRDKSADRFKWVRPEEVGKGFFEGVSRHLIVLSAVAAERQNSAMAYRCRDIVRDNMAKDGSVYLDHEIRIEYAYRFHFACQP